MRDTIEEAHKHRDDGYSRAQAHVQPDPLPKRFYAATGVAPVDGGFAVTLDGRATRTPGRKPVVVPVASLARAMAEEWAAQGELIDAQTMPLVRLVNSGIESGEERLPTLREEILSYAGNDLLLYRADSPRELVAAEESHWDGALVKLARHFGVSFQPTIGIVHQPQPAASLEKFADKLQAEPLLAVTALVSITAITGSGLLAIGLRHRLFSPDEVWTAANVDEDHNIRLWGEVEEASIRRRQRRREFDAGVALLEFLSNQAPLSGSDRDARE